MTLLDPRANPARTIAASAEDLSRLFGLARFAPARRESLSWQLQFCVARSLFQMSNRILRGLLCTARSQALVFDPPLPSDSTWSDDEIAALKCALRPQVLQCHRRDR
jgi:hypothetical protein